MWHCSVLPPLLRLTPLTEAFPWHNLRKILHGSQRMAKVENAKEKVPTVSTNLSRVHKCYRQQTDLR